MHLHHYFEYLTANAIYYVKPLLFRIILLNLAAFFSLDFMPMMIVRSIKEKAWLRFLLYAALAYGFILFFYNVLRDIQWVNDLYVEGLNEFARFLLWASEGFVELFGFEAITFGKTIEIVENFTNKGIYLDRGCMGRNVMLSFAAVIFIFPGHWKNKLWYIPMGLAVITFVNIIRISAMAYIGLRYPQHLDFNHYVVFRAVAWGAIFLMWVIWFNRFSGLSKRIQKAKTTS